MTWLEYNEALQELRTDSELVVGTGAQATWRVRRADLMPRHFIVTADSDRAMIRPFSSDAVVTVNGRQLPVAASELHDGDLIGAGSGEFRYWAATPGESRSTVKAPVTAHLVDTRRNTALSLDRVSTGIGSDESNALVIDTGSASSFHAEVRREAGGHVLRAPESASVTVNGRPISVPKLLEDGDEIGIADQSFRYSRGQLAETVTAAPQHRITSTGEIRVPLASSRVRTSAASDVYSVATMRTPMRAVAFVSSVIAAVAIATLLFLHRGP